MFPGAVYLVDAGDGLVSQFARAGLAFADLRAHFITHLHSDHMAGYYPFYLLNWVGAGLQPQKVQVFGPGRADEHGPPASDGYPAGLPEVPKLPVINPPLPTPGIAEVTGDEQQAAAYDINVRLRDSLPEHQDLPDARTAPLVEASAVSIPAAADFRTPAPEMTPVKVYEDDLVKVTATLVYHWPVFPSFAYRFDTEHGSVVFSGDTSPTPNRRPSAQVNPTQRCADLENPTSVTSETPTSGICSNSPGHDQVASRILLAAPKTTPRHSTVPDYRQPRAGEESAALGDLFIT